MPLDAKWEFAARAGTTTEWSFGGNAANLGSYGWHSGNAGSMTREVGGRRPNPWGLYDMHGNVWEWVWDWWGTPETAPATDPLGAVFSGARVVRGGCWACPPERVRSAHRYRYIPRTRGTHIGFRVVRS